MRAAESKITPTSANSKWSHLLMPPLRGSRDVLYGLSQYSQASARNLGGPKDAFGFYSYSHFSHVKLQLTYNRDIAYLSEWQTINPRCLIGLMSKSEGMQNHFPWSYFHGTKINAQKYVLLVMCVCQNVFKRTIFQRRFPQTFVLFLLVLKKPTTINFWEETFCMSIFHIINYSPLFVFGNLSLLEKVLLLLHSSH